MSASLTLRHITIIGHGDDACEDLAASCVYEAAW